MQGGDAASAAAMGDPGVAEMSVMDIVVWVIRVSLPIILFFIWYRAQPDKGPTGNVYGRQEIMDARQAAEEQEPPEALLTLRLVSEAQVQKVLGIPGPRGSAGQGGGGRREAGKGKGKGDKGGGRGRGGGGSGVGGGRGSEAAAPAAPADVDPFALGDEERMHVEALFNFIAFSYKERPQRIFLPEDDHPPPPPPKRPSAGASEANMAESAKANMEAQLVLKGLINPTLSVKSSAVAKTLNEHLSKTSVAPAEGTYSLMVESCVNAGDLRAASDFLNKMESAGHCADSQLLDKVMDLYSETRTGPPPLGGSLGLGGLSLGGLGPSALAGGGGAASSGLGGGGRPGLGGGGGLSSSSGSHARGGGGGARAPPPWMDDEEPDFSLTSPLTLGPTLGGIPGGALGMKASSLGSAARTGTLSGGPASAAPRKFSGEAPGGGRPAAAGGAQRSPWSDDEDFDYGGD